MSARVAVVIPYYDGQRDLDLLLAALELQDAQAVGGFEVVVVDDGSPMPPRLGQRPYPIRTVRQDDLGFRASAARALGAVVTDAPVLVFLDADTVPTPGLLAALTQDVGAGPCGTLVVGRRRHADLGGWSPDRLRAWFVDGGDGPTELGDPQWLADGYAQTDDLRRADDRSYRFVISAVLALPRALYEAAGGFDPGFVGYGGEDWDLAHRAFLAGGDLLHVPDAVAWHDGPDLAGREDPAGLRAVKDAETLQLAHVLTDPLARGAGLRWRYPHTVVVLHGVHEPGLVAACAASVLDGADAQLWCVDLAEPPAGLEGQVHVGPVPRDVLQRARLVADLPVPVAGRLPTTPCDVGVEGGVVTVRSSRDLARGERWAPADAPGGGLTALRPGPTLEARWAGWA